MRLFVAILLEEAVRKSLMALVRRLEPRCASVRLAQVRFIPAENLHVTLKFLGETPDSKVATVCAALEEVSGGAVPFEMSLQGTGVFPPRGAVRIIWAGLHEPGGHLLKLAESIESAMAELGYRRENRAFSPHITIARVSDDRSGGRIRELVEAEKVSAVSQPVREVMLMSSTLSIKGSKYSVVRTLNIGHQAR